MNTKDWMKAEFPKLLWQECLSSACVAQRWVARSINLVAPLCILCSPPTLSFELVHGGWSQWISWPPPRRQSSNSHRGWDFLTHHIRGGVVSVATRCCLDGPGVKSLWRRDFLYQSLPVLEPTQPPIQWAPSLFWRGEEWLRRGVDYPTPLSLHGLL